MKPKGLVVPAPGRRDGLMATSQSPAPSWAEDRPPGSSALARSLNLTRELAITQFKLKYAGSVLGYIWSLAKPLMLFAIMYAVFARLLRVGASSPNFAIQLLMGIIVWSFFSETTTGGLQSIVGNTHLVKKAFFPRSIIVISATLTAFMNFAINLGLLVLIAGLLGKLDLGGRSLWALPLVFELYALTLGAALLLATLYVFFRDVWYIWEISSQVLFYASAVVYPLAFVPPSLERVIALNPLTQIIEDLRHGLVTHQVPWTADVLGMNGLFVPLLIAAAVVLVGWIAFNHWSPRFAEYL